MPQYTYEHPKTGEKIDVIQSMSEKHEFIKDGVTWRRVFYSCQASFDTMNIDPFKVGDFTKKTGSLKNGGKISDLYDRSKELSEKRKQIAGIDPIRLKYEKDYAAARKGRKLPTKCGSQIFDR